MFHFYRLVHRHDPQVHDDNEIWTESNYPEKPKRPLTPSEIEKMIAKAEREAKVIE